MNSWIYTHLLCYRSLLPGSFSKLASDSFGCSRRHLARSFATWYDRKLLDQLVQPFLQGVLVAFSGKWYLEITS